VLKTRTLGPRRESPPEWPTRGTLGELSA
jgi:hypothetical protein